LTYGHAKCAASFLRILCRNPGTFLILYSGYTPSLHSLCFVLLAAHPWTHRPCPKWHTSYALSVLWTYNGCRIHRSVKYMRLCHFRFQKGAHQHPLCGQYSPSMRTFAEHALMRALQQTSSQQSKWHSQKSRLIGRPQVIWVPFVTLPLFVRPTPEMRFKSPSSRTGYNSILKPRELWLSSFLLVFFVRLLCRCCHL